ncbi:MAG: LamG domain-containing protein, partial [Candidatus Gribaldobacteria bacterium]|nr:LamG domain-containing protein [Candidatus Gribaldobacteria bacterium]
GTGQYAYDSSGNGNTGRLGTSTSAEPADPTWTTGKLGKGLSFDGVNDYVGMGNVLDFERTSSFTVSAWVKRGATGTTQIIASKMLNSGTYRGWNVWFFSDNTIHFILRNTVETSQLQPVTANTFSSTANWYYVTVTYNGNSLASGVNFYVNGVLQAQGTPLYNNLSATTIT